MFVEEGVIVVLLLIGLQLLVKIHFDGAHVGGTHGRHRIEAMVPVTNICYPLVEDEQVSDPSHDRRVHTKQLPREVPAELDLPVGGGVEAVVVPRGQIDDALIEGVFAVGQAAAVEALIVVLVDDHRPALTPAVGAEESAQRIRNTLKKQKKISLEKLRNS